MADRPLNIRINARIELLGEQQVRQSIDKLANDTRNTLEKQGNGFNADQLLGNPEEISRHRQALEQAHQTLLDIFIALGTTSPTTIQNDLAQLRGEFEKLQTLVREIATNSDVFDSFSDITSLINQTEKLGNALTQLDFKGTADINAFNTSIEKASLASQQAGQHIRALGDATTSFRPTQLLNLATITDDLDNINPQKILTALNAIQQIAGIQNPNSQWVKQYQVEFDALSAAAAQAKVAITAANQQRDLEDLGIRVVQEIADDAQQVGPALRTLETQLEQARSAANTLGQELKDSLSGRGLTDSQILTQVALIDDVLRKINTAADAIDFDKAAQEILKLGEAGETLDFSKLENQLRSFDALVEPLRRLDNIQNIDLGLQEQTVNALASLNATELREVADVLKRLGAENLEDVNADIRDLDKNIGLIYASATQMRTLDPFDAIVRSGNQADASTKRIAGNLLDMTFASRQSEAAMGRFASAWNRITTSAAADALRVGLGINQIETELDQMGHAANRAGPNLLGVFDTTRKDAIGNVARGFFGAMGNQLEDFFYQAIYNVFDFFTTRIHEDFAAWSIGMAEIFTLLPEAAAHTRHQLEEEIAGIATQFGYLQEEILPTAYQAISLGIKPGNVEESLATAAQAARAGVTDLQPTLEVGQALVNAYGGELYSLNEVYDLLFYGVKRGAVTMSDFNGNMAEIIAVSGDAGVALEDIVAAIITMSRQGDDMETISRLLSHLLTQIQVSGSALGGAFVDAAGIDFRSFIAQGGTLVQALELIEKHARKTGVSITEMVGGNSKFYRDQQGMIAVMELTGKHFAGFESYAAEARNASGLMLDAYEEVASTITITSEITAAAVEDAARRMGEAALPMKKAWLDFKTARYESISDWLTTLDHTDLLAQLLANEETKIQELKKRGGNIDIYDAILAPDERGIQKTNEELALTLNLLNAIASTTPGLSFFDDTAAGPSIQSQIAELEVVLAAIDNKNFSGKLSDWVFDLAEQDTPLGHLIASMLEYEGITRRIDNRDGRGTKHRIPDIKNEKEAVDKMAASYRELAQVEEIIDGDTFEFTIEGVAKKVRLLGVDAPEIESRFGDEAIRFTQDFIAEGGEISLSRSYGETYERELRKLMNETGDSLDAALVSAGLALPVSLDLLPPTEQQYGLMLQELSQIAQDTGQGIFSNVQVVSALAAGNISTTAEAVAIVDAQVAALSGGALSWAEKMDEAMQQGADAQGEYVTAYHNHAQRIAEIQAILQEDLTSKQRKELNKQEKDLEGFGAEASAIYAEIVGDLTPKKRASLEAELAALQSQQGQPYQAYTGDTEAETEAQEKINALLEERSDILKQLAFDSILPTTNSVEDATALAVALGLITDEAGEMAVAMAYAYSEIERASTVPSYLALEAQYQADAVQLLIDGMVDTAEEAVQRVAQARAGDMAAYQPGIGHDYWNYDNYVNEILNAGQETVIEIPVVPVLPEDDPEQIQQWLSTLTGEAHTLEINAETTQLFLDFNNIDTRLLTIEEADPDIEIGLPNKTEIEDYFDFVNLQAVDRYFKIYQEVVTTGNPIPQGPPKALGGYVDPFTQYRVGEFGPELFIPSVPGFIISNHNLKKMQEAASGGTTNYINVTVTGGGDVHETKRAAYAGVSEALSRRGY